MDILTKKTAKIILVHFNEIPFVKLSNRSFIEQLSKKFLFNGVEAIQGPDGNTLAIQAQNGLFTNNDNLDISINKLFIEDRKIQIMIDSSSDDADKLYEQLRFFFIELSGDSREQYLQPLVNTNETELESSLSFPITQLFSTVYLDFANSILGDVANNEIANAEVKPMSLRFSIDYLPKENLLSDYRINLARKEFILEVAKGYPAESQIYYSKAPLSTTDHIKLLEQLENLMKE